MYLRGRQEVKDERPAPGIQFVPHSLHGCTRLDESTSLAPVLNKGGGGRGAGQSEGEKAGNDMRSEGDGAGSGGGGGGAGALNNEL